MPEPRQPGPGSARRRDEASGLVSDGVLVLVVGPSGAGKDTLIDGARSHFVGHPRLLFPRRTITRAPSTGELHRAVSLAEFHRLKAEGAFFLDWQAHDLRYAIPIEVAGALGGGAVVVVNTSRTVIGEACRLWPRTRVVEVHVSANVLRQRLLARGREDEAAVDGRLRRARAIEIEAPVPIDTIDNSGDITVASAGFVALIEGYATDRASRRSSRKPAPPPGSP